MDGEITFYHFIVRRSFCIHINILNQGKLFNVLVCAVTCGERNWKIYRSETNGVGNYRKFRIL